MTSPSSPAHGRRQLFVPAYLTRSITRIVATRPGEPEQGRGDDSSTVYEVIP